MTQSVTEQEAEVQEPPETPRRRGRPRNEGLRRTILRAAAELLEERGLDGVTIEAIAEDLTEDGLVLRYRNREGLNADGLSGEEGTFVLCSFWLVSCLAMAGEVDRAEALYDRLTGYANDLGLLAEEIETASGEQLGNFPQAFSHFALVNAAFALGEGRAMSPAID